MEFSRYNKIAREKQQKKRMTNDESQNVAALVIEYFCGKYEQVQFLCVTGMSMQLAVKKICKYLEFNIKI